MSASWFVAPLLLLLAACGGGTGEEGAEKNPNPIATNSEPTISISSPSSNAKFETASVVTFTGSASDNEDGDISHIIAWTSSIDGSLGNGSNLARTLSAGTHTITAAITDSGDLKTEISISIEIVAPSSSNNQSPLITINTPDNDITVDDSTSIQFSAQATDQEDGELSQAVNWSSSIDGDLGNGASANKILSVGSHTIVASVKDSGDLTAQATINVEVISSTASNNPPTVNIDSPTNGESVSQQDIITFTATANDEEDGDLSSEIRWKSDIDGELGVGANIGSQLSIGQHTITVTVTDSGELSGTATINLTVNATEGMATISWNSPNTNTDNSELTDLTGFKIYYGKSTDNLDQVITIDDPETTAWVVENLDSNSTYYFSVTAVNSSGYESDYSNIASKDISG